MNALVTGGAGFIGSEFVKSALRGKFAEFNFNLKKLFIVDSLTYAGKIENLQETINDTRLEFIHANIQNESLINKLMKNCDLVINFAAESHVDRSIQNAQDFIDSNIRGVFTLLDAARNNGIWKFIQISTDEVYGSIGTGSSLETDKLLPNSPYSASKAAADLLVRSYNKTYSLNTLVTRTCNNFGPFQYPEKLIPVLVESALRNLPLPVYGNGKNIREWIPVAENCRAIAFLIKKDHLPGIVNIGSGICMSNNEIAKLILKYIPGTKSTIKYVEDRKGHDYRYSLNSSLLNSLGFNVNIDFETSLKETIDWYRNYFK